jgi:hypothetical protein
MNSRKSSQPCYFSYHFLVIAGKFKKNGDDFLLDETTLKVDANTCALKLVYTIWR